MFLFYRVLPCTSGGSRLRGKREARSQPKKKKGFCAFVVLGFFGRQRIQDWFYFRPKIRGGPRPPGPLPWIHNWAVIREFYPSQHVTWYLDWKWSSGWLGFWEGQLLETTRAEPIFTGCRNVSRQQQSFSGLQSSRWSFSMKVCCSWIQTILLCYLIIEMNFNCITLGH